MTADRRCMKWRLPDFPPCSRLISSACRVTAATHSEIKRILQNRRYLGDDVYPRIIDDETFNAVQDEQRRREKALGRDRILPKEKPVPVVYTDFYTKKSTQKYTDPIAQAEYAYGRIEGKVNK